MTERDRELSTEDLAGAGDRERGSARTERMQPEDHREVRDEGERTRLVPADADGGSRGGDRDRDLDREPPRDDGGRGDRDPVDRDREPVRGDRDRGGADDRDRGVDDRDRGIDDRGPEPVRDDRDRSGDRGIDDRGDAGRDEHGGGHDDRGDDRGGGAPRAGGARDGTGHGAQPLLHEEDAEELRGRWDGVQVAFVDEPRGAVADADALVAEVIQRLSRRFADERAGLEAQWDRGEEVSTDELRMALQRYRSFFHRLLETQS